MYKFFSRTNSIPRTNPWPVHPYRTVSYRGTRGLKSTLLPPLSVPTVSSVVHSHHLIRIPVVSVSTLPPRIQASLEENVLQYVRQLPWSNSSSSFVVTPHTTEKKTYDDTKSTIPTVTLGDLGIVQTVTLQTVPSSSSSTSSSNPLLRLTLKFAFPFASSTRSQTLLTTLPSLVRSHLTRTELFQTLGLSINDIMIQCITVPYLHHQENIAKAGKGLTNVGSIIAVSSCKGGVGKSTVAVNLTFALAQLMKDNYIGLLDTDIYGPSLPTMVQPVSVNVKQNEENGTILPLTVPSSLVSPSSPSSSLSSLPSTASSTSVACMSYGWVSRRNERGERGGAVMRGPMVSQVVGQLLRLTEWGNLHHLVLDMPPGTGDIPITIGQTVPITGAIIVTTPQKLAIVDVRKGLDMFKTLKVPPLAIILNMTHFDAPDTGKRYYPFGTEGMDQVKAIMKDYGIPENRLFTLPLDSALSAAGDNGIPEVVAHPQSSLSQTYKEIAQVITDDIEHRIIGPRIATLHMEQSTGTKSSSSLSSSSSGTNIIKINVKYDSSKQQINVRTIKDDGAWDTYLSPAKVRRACKCALCVDEMTGKQRLQPEKVPETVIPTSITEAGNYGVTISWSDGHSSSIYTYDQLQTLSNV